MWLLWLSNLNMGASPVGQVVASTYPDPLQAKWELKTSEPDPLQATWKYKVGADVGA